MLMAAFIDILMTIGVFVAGLAARLGVVLGIAPLLLAPVLLAWEGFVWPRDVDGGVPGTPALLRRPAATPG